MNKNTWDSLSGEHRDAITGTFRDLEPTDFFQPTMEKQAGDYAKWEEFNGAGTAIMLDPAEAQKLLAPAISKLCDEIFGAGTYDKLQAL